MTHCHGILIEILWSQNLTEPLVFLLKWHYTLKYLLKTIYYSLFNSHVIYASQIWGQSKSDHFRKLVELQDKALKFPSWHGSFKRDIHKNSKILKLHDYIALQTTLLIKDFFSEKLPKPLNEHSKKLNQHSMYTQFYFCSWSTHQNVQKKFYQVSVKDHGTTLTKSYKSICCSKPRGMQKI